MAEAAHDDADWRRYFDESRDLTLPNGDVFRTYSAGTHGPHIVLLHGGGYTSMTWCLATALLKSDVRVHAFDLRAHGSTKTSNDADLSITTLVQDCIIVINQLIPEGAAGQEPVVLVGHSLGGALAVRVAASKEIKSLAGFMVIDVVEGTAIASLEHMHVILGKRPQSFPSIAAAIDWSLHSGTVRNPEAARVSIPSQVVQRSNGSFGWRTDLKSSAPFWRDWFAGLSEQFLSIPLPKILVLAGSDRLDTALTRGQMQGKFELRLLYGTGHVIQEDCPSKLVEAILEFCGRCSLSVGGSFRPGGAVKSASEILAEKLAKARAMVPK